MVTGSVYTDINGEGTDPNIRMIDALLGVVAGNAPNADEIIPAEDEHHHRQKNLPRISYIIYGQVKLMNN